MKKFFLIPLMTLMCSVMAWGTNVAQIDEVQFESLSAAIASLDGDQNGQIDPTGNTYKTITLLANVTEDVTVDMSLAVNSTKIYLEFDLAGHVWNGDIAWTSGSSNDAYLRIKNGTYNGTISISGGSGYLKLEEPGENGLSGSIATTGDKSMSLQLPSSGTFSADLNIGTTTNVLINANLTYTGAATFSENATLTMSAATAEFSPKSLTGTPIFKLTGGKTNFDPTDYLAAGYYATFADGKYTINVHNVYNNTKAQGYADFISAYEAASSGDSLTIIQDVTAGNGNGSYTFDKYVRLGGAKTLTFNFENVEFNNEYQNFNVNFIIPAICTATFTAGLYNAKYYNGILGNIIVNGADVTLSASGPQVKAGKTWTLNSGTLSATYASNMSVAAGGTLTISGGELVLRNYLGITLGAKNGANANFNMSNGKIICYTENAIAISSASGAKAKFNITGGEIEYRYSQSFDYIKGAALYLVGTVDGESVFENFSIKAYDNTIATTNATFPYAGGRGIYNSKNNNIVLNNVSIDAYDAALHSTNGTWTLNNCTFVSRIGNAICTATNKTINITNGTFKSEAPAESNKEVIATTSGTGTFTFNPSGDLSVYTLLAQPTINGLTNIFEEQPAGSHWFVLTGHSPNTIAEVRKNGGAVIEVATMADVLELFPVSTIETLDITLLRDYKLDVSDPLAVYAGKVCNLDLNGHKLTVDGTSRKLYVSGTLNINGETAGSEIKISKGDGIYVEDGGEVNVSGGKYTTTSSGRVFENDGTLNLNNAVVDAWYRGIYNSGIANLVNTSVFSDANYAIYTSGTEQKQAKLYIKGLNSDSIRSNSSTKHGSYSYAIRVHNNAYCSVTKGGANNDENINISGVQGGLAVSDDAIADIYGGKFDTRTCPYGGGNYYALYVAVDAIANVYGGKFSTAEDAVAHEARPAIFCGNNDITSILGIANIYGGVMSNKAYVQHAPTNTFPASVPNVSQWYSSFGTDVPLPAGYEYYEIIAAGTPEGKQVVDADAYAAGYRWQVVCTNNDTKEVNVTDPTATIPWQQNTTWDPNANPEDTGIVPEETTIVTIPIDATVIVKNDPSMDTLAVAEQIFVNQGATLKVEPGTTLNVGDGGVNIANGGQIVVEPGAIVTVGDAGIITTEDEALVIESSEQQQGVLLLNPEVTENTQPKATVKLTTKAKQIAENDYIYERFAIPTIDGNATVYNVEDAASVVLYPGETELKHGLYKWDGSDWAFMSSFKQMEPFKGYQLTNNSANADVVYTFEGNLVGNHNEDYSFASAGFGFFGNSYTGAIDIKKFLDSFGDEMQKTIWIYDYYTDGFKTITPESYGTVKYGTRRNSHGTITEIRSMQAFLMNRSEAGSTSVNYESAIWGNPKYGLVSTPDPAPAKRVAANEDKVTIYVATDTQEDEVTFIRSNEYSSAFDNGADASKWMNNGMNLYVVNGDENMAIVASDEIADMTIAFRSGNESEYTLGFDNLAGQEFSIKDVLTGATVLMTEGATYTFTQEPNTTVPARFQIVGGKKVVTGIENATEGATVEQKVIVNGVLYILRDNKWYNAQGQMVK